MQCRRVDGLEDSRTRATRPSSPTHARLPWLSKPAGSATPAIDRASRRRQPEIPRPQRTSPRTRTSTASSIYRDAAKNPVKFWERLAKQLDWFKPWKKASRVEGAQREVVRGRQAQRLATTVSTGTSTTARRTKAALIWEGEPGDTRTLTYWDLYREVNRFAAALKQHGVKKGDRVTIYMPMVPEAGHRHARVHPHRRAAQRDLRRLRAGRGPRPHPRRGVHACCITADGGYRRGSIVPLKKNVDEALKECPDVKTVVVLKRTGQDVAMAGGPRRLVGRTSSRTRPPTVRRSRWTPRTCCTSSTRRAPPASPRASCTRPAATSPGSTRRPSWVFDLKDTDVYWCTADIGWVTGHSYVVYGPLANGATTRDVRGHAGLPGQGPVLAHHRAATASRSATPRPPRSAPSCGGATSIPKRCDLSTLRLLGIGRRADQPEAWVWYWKVIGGGRCPVVDTWWQTETGHILITPLPGITVLKPGSATQAVPGIEAERGQRQGRARQGRLSRPHKAVARHAPRHLPRSRALRGAVLEPAIPGIYFTGDGAKQRRGRLLLAARPRGRRHERLRPPRLHDGGRVRPGRSIPRRRGGGDRAGRTRSRARPSPPSSRSRTVTRTPRSCMDELKAHVDQEDRRALARPDDLIFAADLPKTRTRQDHAAAAARHRRGQGAGRYHHPGRSHRGGATSRTSTARKSRRAGTQKKSSVTSRKSGIRTAPL